VARGRSGRERTLDDRTFTAGLKKRHFLQGVPQAADPQPSFGCRNRTGRLSQRRFR
jgi:hypothetical protein